tara:strand:- start:191 stop:313 length:123 start_codon:yes stop_codon:yes gene_type:complete
MKDKIKLYKELAFVYIVDGKKFLCEKKAKKYLKIKNKDRV